MPNFKRQYTTSSGLQRVAVEKTDIDRKTLYSHNWCDRTTWYGQSVRVLDEIAVDSGDHIRYDLEHTYIIDAYHGKLSEEDYLTDDNGYDYRVSVTVDGILKAEQDPHYGFGADFIVAYEDGYIQFENALTGSEVVKVTYHYENGSRYTIKPLDGKLLQIACAEIQFSTDIELKDALVFDVRGSADILAPGYYPPGTMIPVSNPVIYKTMADFYNDAVKAYPAIPAVGGSGWRGQSKPVIVMDWDYVSVTSLQSSLGLEIRISLQHEEEIIGTYATATFYCISADEPQ